MTKVKRGPWMWRISASRVLEVIPDFAHGRDSEDILEGITTQQGRRAREVVNVMHSVI